MSRRWIAVAFVGSALAAFLYGRDVGAIEGECERLHAEAAPSGTPIRSFLARELFRRSIEVVGDPLATIVTSGKIEASARCRDMACVYESPADYGTLVFPVFSMLRDLTFGIEDADSDSAAQFSESLGRVLAVIARDMAPGAARPTRLIAQLYGLKHDPQTRVLEVTLCNAPDAWLDPAERPVRGSALSGAMVSIEIIFRVVRSGLRPEQIILTCTEQFIAHKSRVDPARDILPDLVRTPRRGGHYQHVFGAQRSGLVWRHGGTGEGRLVSFHARSDDFKTYKTGVGVAPT